MNLNIKKHSMDSHDKTASASGVGANALWNGPFNTGSLPKGKGSSSGANGIKLRFDMPVYTAGPITQKVK